MVADGQLTDVDREARLLSLLRSGDEHAFESLVAKHAAGMLRVARTYVASDVAAEDVVQDTWVAVMRGLEQFEGRCTVKTWLYRILINRSKSMGIGDRRTVPMSALHGENLHGENRTVAPDRFYGAGEPDVLGRWSDPPRAWQRDPQTQAIGAELLRQLRAAIEVLPEPQRRVVILRDVEGMSAAETAELLDLSAVNQRSLLHRGRARLRQSLEAYLALEGSVLPKAAR